ncbi:MAG TPA: alpha/beta hydrolase [Solirubrobacteraceae bacterium]|jgi:pimeloyl-ACP methyl ester carboxylesterase|nr:alpha/beta hydrolase [Solirubrobacteraceae bacterium]
MPSIDLPHGTVRYRVAGPENAAAPPVVFVHGFLVSSTLWSDTADALAATGVRSYAADWPLGSHTIALAPDADQSPRGIARQVIAFMQALELDDVTLVGNDTGGAICQLLLDIDASRIGRVVLTNCDAFTDFPPAPFGQLFKAFRSPRTIRALMAPMRAAAVRHSPAGYGLLVNHPLDAEQTRAWVEPCLSDAAIRRDVARFAKQVDPGDLDAASKRLGDFDGPALLIWGAADRFFKLDFARRLRATFSDARLLEVENGRTFVPHDEPKRLAEEIAAFQSA